MKKKTDTAYVKGIFSSVLILLLLAVLTVFPNIWDNLASGLAPVLFKSVPFAVLLLSSAFILCLLQGISFLFYSERKGKDASLKSPLLFFSPKRFFRLVKLYAAVSLIRLMMLLSVFVPTGLVVLCTLMFYENGCPMAAVGIMSAASVAALVLSLRFYGEMSLLLFLSPYCFFENEKGQVRDILKESFRRMKGKGGRIRRLRQSFFLSFLSCLFLLPIPFVLTNYKSALTKRACELMREG